MKITIYFLAFISCLFISSCTIEEPLDELIISEYPIEFSLDKHRYDFTKMKDSRELENIEIEEITLNPISSTWTYEFEEMTIDSSTYQNYAYNYTEQSIPAGIVFPGDSISQTATIPLQFDNFKWAIVDKGKLYITLQDGKIPYKSIYLSILNDYDETILPKTNLRIDANNDGEIDQFEIDLKDKRITQNLELTLDFVWEDYDNGLDTNDNLLTLKTSTSEMSIKQASARFSNFKDESFALDSTFTTEFEGVKARSITIYDGEFYFKVNNQTALTLNFDIDLSSSLIDENNQGVHVQQAVKGGNSYEQTSILKSVVFRDENFDSQAIPLSSTVYVNEDQMNEDDFVLVSKGDKVTVSTRISEQNTPDGDLVVESVTGDLVNYVVEIDAITNEIFAEDSEIENLEGLLIKQGNLAIDLTASRPDFKIDEILFNLLIKGKEAADTLRITKTFTNFNSGTIEIKDVANIFRNYPDSITFSGSVNLNSTEVLLKNDDYFTGVLNYGFPISFEITGNGFDFESTEVQEIEALDPEEDQEDSKIEIDELYLNALVNNPTINVTCSLYVQISDTTTYDDDLMKLVNPQELVAFEIKGNPEGKPYLVAQKPGVKVQKEALDLMLENDTYLSQRLRIFPTNGQVITIKPEDYIDIQLGFSGKTTVTVKIDNDEE